jgi:hypothetical protein
LYDITKELWEAAGAFLTGKSSMPQFRAVHERLAPSTWPTAEVEAGAEAATGAGAEIEVGAEAGAGAEAEAVFGAKGHAGAENLVARKCEDCQLKRPSHGLPSEGVTPGTARWCASCAKGHGGAVDAVAGARVKTEAVAPLPAEGDAAAPAAERGWVGGAAPSGGAFCRRSRPRVPLQPVDDRRDLGVATAAVGAEPAADFAAGLGGMKTEAGEPGVEDELAQLRALHAQGGLTDAELASATRQVQGTAAAHIVRSLPVAESPARLEAQRAAGARVEAGVGETAASAQKPKDVGEGSDEETMWL